MVNRKKEINYIAGREGLTIPHISVCIKQLKFSTTEKV